LNASGCELNGGLNYWGSVTFSGASASSSVLNNVFIKNGIGIRCLNGANVNIQNSIIYLCTEGIYFYNSQPTIQYNQIIEPVQNGINGDASGLSPLILHNTITKTVGNPKYKNYQGIILGNSTNGYIAHNDISGFYWGMYIGGGSDAYFSNYSHQLFNPNNRVRDNLVGVGSA
jgi:parallel beta-helix repeat protein